MHIILALNEITRVNLQLSVSPADNDANTDTEPRVLYNSLHPLTSFLWQKSSKPHGINVLTCQKEKKLLVPILFVRIGNYVIEIRL